MHTTRQAEKVSDSEDTTTKQPRFVLGIMPNGTPSTGRTGTSQSGVYVILKKERLPDSDGSIWGWARMHRFSAERGISDVVP
jgi:hypothetical protein